jgi:hypothetical protein
VQWKIHWEGDVNDKIFNNKEDAIKNDKKLVAGLPKEGLFMERTHH